MTPTPSDDHRVHLDYYGQVLSRADDEPNHDTALSYRRLIPVEADDGTIRIVRSVEPMFSPTVARANLGLRDAILVEALEQGRTIEHRRRTRLYPQMPPPAEIQPLAGRPINTHVLQFVHEKERGVILLGTGVGRSAILAELVQAFPRQQFAVMTATHGESKTVHAGLRKLNIRCQRMTSNSNPRSTDRIVVGKYSSLRHRRVEFEKREILIAYDARQTLAEQAQQLLTQPDVCGRLFGFLGADTHLSPNQEDQLAAMFGFDQVAVPAYGFRSVAVDACFTKFRGKGVTTKKSVTSKRHGLWKNGHRNQQLTKLARALAEGDLETVSQFLPEYETHRDPLESQRVALLTDSVEHIAGLADRLRHWPVRLDRDYFDAGLPPHEQRLLAKGLSRWITGEVLITTPQGLSEVRPGSFDVVIWAGSGTGFPPIPWPHLVCPASEPRRLLLIDVRDRHHPQLRRWSRQRRNLYQEVGWMDEGMNRTLARICRFLEQKNAEVGQ